MIAPRATYRLQLNKDFTFARATALVPYLDDLGISHVYLSPILMAHPGSTHGYDIVDHTRINPELGSLDDFRAFAAALHRREMGILLDFVPNHMGVGGADNALWLDVLKYGAASRYADWFDIDWQFGRPGMEGKLLMPFLGASYRDSLLAGDLRLKADGDGLAVWAYDAHKLPIRADDTTLLLERHGSAETVAAAHAGQAGHADSWLPLHRLMARQHWRLAHFSVAADEINYRRFFVNSELAGIRIDRGQVFDHVHKLVFSLVAEGLIDGLRIDHIDGLLDPKGYLDALRARLPRPVYLVVEKILAPHEAIRADWPVEGTTGYEVGAQLTRVLMHEPGEAEVTASYIAFTGDLTPVPEQAYQCKLRVMDNELAAELTALARRLAAIAWSVSATSDLTQAGLRRALRETIAQLSVYRTYAKADGLSSRDGRELNIAIARARRSQSQIQPALFDFIAALLSGRLPAAYDRQAVADAIGRFQQYTGPVMAKGVEDTALYRYNRLAALNEVGAHPERFSLSIAAFHDANRRRLATHPGCLLSTSTHDSKRGEDIRSIIAAIADEPGLWSAAVRDWHAILAPDAAGLHANDLYLFFQLLLGGWPIEGDAADLAQRLRDTMTKSLREARWRSDWGVKNVDYETAFAAFIDRALANESFLASFHPTRRRLQAIGRRKALIQTALKLTVPGVPDIYRGAEDWEQSFVDPDNRRPLDFAALARRLARPLPVRDEKLLLTRALLHFRRRAPQLFAAGSYEPLPAGDNVLAFRRRHGDVQITVFADLSSGHQAGLAEVAPALPTIFGSASGPIWIMAG
ncbi:malto-oligosyltrehalose synthase [Devosia sp. YIM 151766]|uniref:malto-oligosyltrehalose synthase n=1 Tax=Devosia sp. YIM 151766 TaxID=3017325 RepID=UPI00255C57B0|nr:malto-oligosyltrehalose synthase [Devosia sp. YIM 151766]WIY53572.1 malto-oligosyltrehalose synthase [Devosia sp. YIM 151766]